MEEDFFRSPISYLTLSHVAQHTLTLCKLAKVLFFLNEKENPDSESDIKIANCKKTAIYRKKDADKTENAKKTSSKQKSIQTNTHQETKGRKTNKKIEKRERHGKKSLFIGRRHNTLKMFSYEYANILDKSCLFQKII